MSDQFAPTEEEIRFFGEPKHDCYHFCDGSTLEIIVTPPKGGFPSFAVIVYQTLQTHLYRTGVDRLLRAEKDDSG